MTSPTELALTSGGLSDAELELWDQALLDGLDTGSSSSTSSASSPQSSRSGTSSRSLRGLTKTWLVACLPALLVGASAQIQPLLDRGTFEGGKNGRTTP